MFKKILALVAGCAFSITASAGYVQYNFGGQDSAFSGYFVQHDDDKTIAYFRFQMHDSEQKYGAVFFPTQSEGAIAITSTRTYSHGLSPTSFTIYDDFGADQKANFNIEFLWDNFGKFEYVARYSTYRYFSDGWKTLGGTYYGSVTQGPVEAGLAEYLDSRGGYEYSVSPILPVYVDPYAVPEPASLALMTAGAIGALAAARRRRKI